MSVFPYQASFDVHRVENGIIIRQTTPEGLDYTTVYESHENFTISSAVKRDIFSVLQEAEKERYFNHIKISVTIEDLTEEGGAQ